MLSESGDRKGFKVISAGKGIEDYSIFEGQSSDDWSAIYVQKTSSHAMKYIYTKYERFEMVELAEFTFSPEIRIIEIPNELVMNTSIPQSQKTTHVRNHLKELGINVGGIQSPYKQGPLLQELGKLKICVFALDSEESGSEYIIPHNLLESDKFIRYRPVVKFTRHPKLIWRTIDVQYADGKDDKRWEEFKDNIHQIDYVP